MIHRRLLQVLLLLRYCSHRTYAQPAVDLFAKANIVYATDKAAAISLYEQAIRLDPSMYAFWTNLGHAKIDIGDYDGAIIAYQTALHLHPTHAKNHYNLGRAYQTKGDTELALTNYDRAIELDENLVNAHYNKALALQDESDLEGATTSYQYALAIDPLHWDARLNLCNVWFAQGDPRTEQCYLQVVADNPTHVRAVVNLAAYYQANLPVCESSSFSSSTEHQQQERNREQQQAQRALSLYQQALVLDAQNTMARHGVASMKQLIKIKSEKSNNKTTSKTDPALASQISDHSHSKQAAQWDENEENEEAVQSTDDDAVVALDPAYVRELFDSYSFHFDQSLAQLEYRSHLLVGKAVGRYLHLDEGDGGSEGGGGQGTGDGTGDDGMILGVDLGAGTGLACGPIKAAIAKAVVSRRRGGRGRGGASTVVVSADRSGTADSMVEDGTADAAMDGTNSLSDEAAVGERVGILGVDLSPKMLQKAQRRACYGDLVTVDVVEFVRAYARRVRCGTGTDTDVAVDGFGAGDTETGAQCSATMASSAAGTTAGTTATAALPTTSLSPDTHPLLDFVVAADVFMYLGDLRPVLTAVGEMLRPGGIVVFTVEALGGGDTEGGGARTGRGVVVGETETAVVGGGEEEGWKEYTLQPSGRIAHSRVYVERVVREVGLVVREVRPEVPRRDRGKAVRGYLVVAERRLMTDG